MRRLDLHGIRHTDVQKVVDQFIYENQNKLPFQIVTGNSDRMKEIVCDILDEYQYNYKIGDFLGFNQGYVEVTS